MNPESSNYYWHPEGIDEAQEPVIESSIPTPEECLDHFKNGPKILPAFRILEKAFAQADEVGLSIVRLRLKMGDTLPQGVPYSEIYYPINPLSHSGKLELARDKNNTVVEFDLVGQNGMLGYSDALLNLEGQGVIGDKIAIDQTEVQQIIPQGPSIQMIDGVLTRSAHSQTNSIVEGFHRVNNRDFRTIIQTRLNSDQPPITRYQFILPPTFEGFGQLAYIHFQQELRPKEPTIPFFMEVVAEFNTEYQPRLNECIYYVLDKFDTNFAERGDKGTGKIVGRVVGGDGKTVIATYTARVGAVRQKLLDYTVNKIVKAAQKTTTEQTTGSEQA